MALLRFVVAHCLQITFDIKAFGDRYLGSGGLLPAGTFVTIGGTCRFKGNVNSVVLLPQPQLLHHAY